MGAGMGDKVEGNVTVGSLLDTLYSKYPSRGFTQALDVAVASRCRDAMRSWRVEAAHHSSILRRSLQRDPAA